MFALGDCISWLMCSFWWFATVYVCACACVWVCVCVCLLAFVCLHTCLGNCFLDHNIKCTLHIFYCECVHISLCIYSYCVCVCVTERKKKAKQCEQKKMERGCWPVAACAPHRLSILKKGGVLASLLPGGPFTCSQNKVFKLLILPF